MTEQSWAPHWRDVTLTTTEGPIHGKATGDSCFKACVMVRVSVYPAEWTLAQATGELRRAIIDGRVR